MCVHTYINNIQYEILLSCLKLSVQHCQAILLLAWQRYK